MVRSGLTKRLVTLLRRVTASGAFALTLCVAETVSGSVLGTFEPRDGQTYFGFTVRLWDGPALLDPAYGDSRHFPTRLQDSIDVELGGKFPTLLAVPTIWQQSDGTAVPFAHDLFNMQKFDSFGGNAIIPFISWNAQTGFNNDSPTGITTQAVAQGALDDYIRQYAQGIAAYGKPVFIRPICSEFNLSDHLHWERSPGANPALTPQDFIDAWRHVVDIFRQVGVTNVAWVWTPGTFPPPPLDWGIDPNIGDYYPGDDYVDWVGADHYDAGPPSFLDPIYQFAVAHNKPFFLAEWGIRHPASILTPGQQQQWLTDMFDYFEAHPKIKAVVYFNYDTAAPYPTSEMARHVFLYNGQVNYQPNVNDGDSRLLAESGANFRGTFASRIANARYVQFPQAPAVGLIANTQSFAGGDTLQVELTGANFGPRTVVDLYWGALLPPQAGPGLGCPGGDAVAFFADGFTRAVITCLSASPQRFAPLLRNVTLPGAMPITTLPRFFTYVWPATLPAGPYVIFAALTWPGSVNVIAIGSVTVNFSP